MLIQWIGACIFAIAIFHTFLVKRFHHLSHRFAKNSVTNKVFHLLGEVELVFGFWSLVLLLFFAAIKSPAEAFTYLESRNFTEPTFVFVILAVCSTQPILELAEKLIVLISRALPFRRPIAIYVTALTVGPILGSVVTEPAAMTVTALLLLGRYYERGISLRLKYATLGVLFVNVSIAGTLTPYAAPPVLMVAGKWGWGLKEMFTLFGWKGALASILSTSFVAFRFRNELKQISEVHERKVMNTPIWIQFVHFTFLVCIILGSHHSIIVVGLFLMFLGFVEVTTAHQAPVRLKDGLLVALFLSGLVVIGGMQNWWLEPVLTKLSALPLYLGAIGLTAFTDNAALTYLGSLVPALSESSRYALVAGAVVGGGLTVIANAPNPAGYNILQNQFGEDGIGPFSLLRAAILPTFIAAICFWIL